MGTQNTPPPNQPLNEAHYNSAAHKQVAQKQVAQSTAPTSSQPAPSKSSEEAAPPALYRIEIHGQSNPARAVKAKLGEIIKIKVLIATTLSAQKNDTAKTAETTAPGKANTTKGKANTAKAKTPQTLPDPNQGVLDVVFEGKVIFSATLRHGVADNPFLAFSLRASKDGPLKFNWQNKNGDQWSTTRQLEIAAG